MLRHTRALAPGAGLTALVVVLAACGGSSPGSGHGSAPVSLSSGVQGLNPGSGPPRRGGTLYMLGQGDVDYMDYNISYYGIGFLAQRAWLRGLYAYPAIPGQTTMVAPDLATSLPAVSNGGKTFSVTIRTGAKWDTSPARQVTGGGRSCVASSGRATRCNRSAACPTSNR